MYYYNNAIVPHPLGIWTVIELVSWECPQEIQLNLVHSNGRLTSMLGQDGIKLASSLHRGIQTL